MKTVKVRFEQDPSLEQIEVVVRAPEQDAQVDALMERMSSDQPQEMLTVNDTRGALRQIAASDIVSVSVNGKVVQIATEDGSFSVRQPLQSFESELDPDRFVRVSRYEIVNLSKVLRYDFTMSGTLRLELAGGTETWASRRCIPAIRSLLKGKG
jgi:DNA-binding LytR/AlgR family response regulator